MFLNSYTFIYILNICNFTRIDLISKRTVWTSRVHDKDNTTLVETFVGEVFSTSVLLLSL